MITNRRITHIVLNNRILLYIILFIGIIFYLAIYLDINRFYNIKKTFFSFKDPIEILEFKKIVRIISHDNMLNAKLEIISNEAYIKVEGFENQLLSKKNEKIRKRNGFHPTVNLAIFSMGYASEYFLNNYNNGSLNPEKIKILEEVYLYVYKEIINPVSVNSMSVNDHAISERIQFIIIFSAYLKEYYPDKTDLLKCLSKDLNICLGFLLEDRSFTWQTNHAIMQLRSLAQLSSSIYDTILKDSILSLFDTRLKEIIPYHLGEDGAIYEGASYYWLYIYEQFTKLAEIESVRGLESIRNLKQKLEKSQKFISTILSNDGFLQGLGDSYSLFNPVISIPDSIPINRYYYFSNELIGANWTVDHYNYGILFVSLNSPPNVHKLPEDLAIYIYINHPFFTNTGTYSYDYSSERLFFLTERSQSTVMMLDQTFKAPIFSKLTINDFNSEQNTLTATGLKRYLDGKSITRFIKINPRNGMYVKDSTNQEMMLVSYFNIYPEIVINKLDDYRILLNNSDSITLSIFSNNPIEVVDGLISERKESLTRNKRLKIIGNPIEVKIYFPDFYLEDEIEFITDNLKNEHRSILASQLELKYGNKDITRNIKSIFLKKTTIILLLLFAFIFLFELSFSNKKNKYERVY